MPTLFVPEWYSLALQLIPLYDGTNFWPYISKFVDGYIIIDNQKKSS